MDDEQPDYCVACGEFPQVDNGRVYGLGLCGHCHWVVTAEVEDGLYKFRQYLKSWARFEEWDHAQN